MKPQLLQENLEKLKIVDGEEVVKVSIHLLVTELCIIRDLERRGNVEGDGTAFSLTRERMRQMAMRSHYWEIRTAIWSDGTERRATEKYGCACF